MKRHRGTRQCSLPTAVLRTNREHPPAREIEKAFADVHDEALNRRVPACPAYRSPLVVGHLAVIDAPGDCDHLVSRDVGPANWSLARGQRTRIGMVAESAEAARLEKPSAVITAKTEAARASATKFPIATARRMP
jgi:hypothetical protein